MLQRSREKEHECQHINGTENILLKGFTAGTIQNYNKKASSWLDSGITWNSLCSGRFLASSLQSCCRRHWTESHMNSNSAGSRHLQPSSWDSKMKALLNNKLVNMLMLMELLTVNVDVSKLNKDSGTFG